MILDTTPKGAKAAFEASARAKAALSMLPRLVLPSRSRKDLGTKLYQAQDTAALRSAYSLLMMDAIQYGNEHEGIHVLSATAEGTVPG